ncbi:hypothetical protein F5884DRAFT_378690 [Xylogone sp. PMI_703]|nr:hypothetical protein F5884DRAFT_378690 [Xylogone sp. PMI_703]
MSTNANREYDKFDTETDDIPQGGDTVDNSYAAADTGKGPIPVLRDEEPVEQPNDRRNPDSDKALEEDERDAIDKGNILRGGRTRGAKPTAGGYNEPGDEEGLPGPNDGTSSTR